MKLYPLLFEASEEFLDSSNLALCQFLTKEFILYDAEKLKEQLELIHEAEGYLTINWVYPTVAGYVKVRPPKTDTGSNCSGAWNIVYSGRNPAYPGAGVLTVKLASSVLGVPLTSDRNSSSTKKAKAMWKRVAGDSSMTRVPLDNWYKDSSFEKQYADVDADGNATDRDGPRTPEPEDDCILPFELDSIGSADAFKASIDAGPLVSRHKEVLKVAASYKISPSEVEKYLQMAGDMWFDKVYHSH